MELKHEPNPTITDTDTIARALFFYTRAEAAAHAASIGWPKNSARKVSLPFGRVRFALSDPHNNILMRDSVEPIDDPDDIRMTVEHLRFDGACADCGSTGHDTGSNTCPGPHEQDRLEAV